MNVCNLYKLSLGEGGRGREHKMEMTFIYESGRQQRAKLHHRHRRWRNAEPMRPGASMPTGSEPRPRLEHKMGGLHLPGAAPAWDEACVNWAQRACIQ